MPDRTERLHRQSARLRYFDYTGTGGYFVTVCTWQRECLFGDIVDGAVLLNDCGVVVRDEWLRTPTIRPNVELDEFIVMPNHFHAIFFINDIENADVGAHRCAPGIEGVDNLFRAHVSAPLRRQSGSVGSILAGFKSAATKRVNTLRDNAGKPCWQRNYYEHVIRNDTDLAAIRQYVADNPMKWALDENHPARG